MGVVDSCFGLVNNAPAGVQNAFSNSHVLEYFQLLGERRGLPDDFPDCGVGVRKMVILMAEAYSVHRHLDDSFRAVHEVESRTPIQPGVSLRQMGPLIRPTPGSLRIVTDCGL